MKKKKKKKIVRQLEDFIADESGFIKKDNMIKIGLGTIAGVGIIGAFSPYVEGLHSSHSSHASHANQLSTDVNPPVPAGCAKIVHNNTGSHVDTVHSSY